MPFTLSRAALLLGLVAATAAPAAAQPADPLALARGLREGDLADLALDYLDDLAAKKPPADVLAVIPLERARARLQLADDEAEDAKRDPLIARARTELEQFILANRTHPRTAEAAVTLARVVSAQAKSALTKANRVGDKAKAATARAAVRPQFTDAANRFGQAADAYVQKLDDADLTPAQKRDITRDVYQALLDRAINQYSLYQTYDADGGVADRDARGKTITLAIDLFRQLANKDDQHPLGWVARAWVGECQRENGMSAESAATFAAVKAAPSKVPVAAAGARQVRFFELRVEVRSAANPAAFRKVQGLAEQWLADAAGRGGKPTPEVFAARYYLAFAKEMQGRGLLVEVKAKDADPKAPPKYTVPDSARALLRAAERDYRRVVTPDNEFSERAARDRTAIIRLLTGDAATDPAKITTFDEALMAAQVQVYKALRETENPDEQAPILARAAALYERAAQLPVPPESARDALDAQANLVFAYMLGGQPYRAAVLGEHLARTTRQSGPAARAGFYSVQAYILAAGKLDPTDADGRRADVERAGRVARLVDERFPSDPNADAVRTEYARALLNGGRYKEAFDFVARVGSASPRAAVARSLQGTAAFELLRPRPAGADDPSGLTAAQKAEVFRKAVADLAAVPEAPPAADEADARRSIVLSLQLAELHILDAPNGYARAEELAKRTADRVAGYVALEDEDKDELVLKAEYVRLRALYAQGLPLFQAGRYADAVAKVMPALAAAAKGGPAAKAAGPRWAGSWVARLAVPAAAGPPEAVAKIAATVDAYRRDNLLVLALQARIRERNVKQIDELFDLMKRLGGSLEASAGALRELVAAVKPQVEELRKQNKGREAQELLDGVNTILDKVAKEPNVPPGVLLALGGSLRDVRNFDKAAEVLLKVPPVPDDLQKRKLTDLEEGPRRQVSVYRVSRLELARTYREAKRFDDAQKVLADALGTKDKPGWAAAIPDFRKESARVLEDKAEGIADPKEAQKVWGAALDKWKELMSDTQPTLKRLAAGKLNARSAVVALTDLRQLPAHEKVPKAPEDVKKDLNATPPPAWVTELLSERRKGPAGVDEPNPAGTAYVTALRNAVTRLEAQIKPAFFDAVFEHHRCTVRANKSLLKDKPADLPAKYASLARQMQDLETKNPDLPQEVKAKYAGLMAEYPELKAQYEKLGKPEPVAAAAPPEGPPTAAETAEPAKPEAAKPAPPPEEGSNVGLLVGAAAGVGMLGVMAVVILASRKRARAVPQRRYGPGSRELDLGD